MSCSLPSVVSFIKQIRDTYIRLTLMLAYSYSSVYQVHLFMAIIHDLCMRLDHDACFVHLLQGFLLVSQHRWRFRASRNHLKTIKSSLLIQAIRPIQAHHLGGSCFPLETALYDLELGEQRTSNLDCNYLAIMVMIQSWRELWTLIEWTRPYPKNCYPFRIQSTLHELRNHSSRLYS